MDKNFKKELPRLISTDTQLGYKVDDDIKLVDFIDNIDEVCVKYLSNRRNIRTFSYVPGLERVSTAELMGVNRMAMNDFEVAFMSTNPNNANNKCLLHLRLAASKYSDIAEFHIRNEYKMYYSEKFKSVRLVASDKGTMFLFYDKEELTRKVGL